MVLKKEEGTINLYKDTTITYELFSIENNAYGFNILKNGRIYIHQPIVPCLQGIKVFANKNDAKNLAESLVYKLNSGKFKFLLQKFELDSLLLHSDNTFKTADEKRYFNAINLSEARKSDSDREIIKELPFLKEAPLKKKWTVKENVPFGYRGGSFSFAIGKYIYIGSGEFRDAIIKDFWCFDTYNETWTCLAEIPAKCFSGIAFSIFNKGYAGLGTEFGTSSGKFEKHMFQYDPEINSWKSVKNFPGTGRIDASVFIINNKAYIGSGYDGSNTCDFYEYNPQKEIWKRIADFAGGNIHGSVGIGTGKRGFIVAGARAPNDFKFVYEYVPSKNKWERRHDIPSYARNFLSGEYIDSNFLIAGCGGTYEKDKRLRDFYLYNILTDTWSNIPDYPVGITGNSRPCGANVDGRIFMGTGFNENFLNDWNVFEYYFTIRKDAGDYEESTGYPLRYNNKWEMFEECSDRDCFAGVELKTNQELGNFYYGSSYEQELRSIKLNEGAGEKLVLLPRNFSIKTDKQPMQPVTLRLFFTKNELEKALSNYDKKTALINLLNFIQVLQCNEPNPNLKPFDNSFKKDTYTFIKPKWYKYGYNGETIVAEFSVISLHSEFYLTISSH